MPIPWVELSVFLCLPTAAALMGRSRSPAMLPPNGNLDVALIYSPGHSHDFVFHSDTTFFPWTGALMWKAGSGLQWGSLLRIKERSIAGCIWNSFVFQKHKNHHHSVYALCNIKLFRNCFVLGSNSHMIHHEMKSGKSFWVNGPINSIDFPWQHRLQHSTTNKRL